MNRILILGCKGTLGRQLLNLYPNAVGWDREDVDVTDFDAFQAKVSALGFAPDSIINCIAFNDVDGAEDREEQALALNAVLVGNLASFTRAVGIPLVHYSTNYVFDGVAGEYVETDCAAPLSAYGRSKLLGERLLAQNGGWWYLIRTAVIFGPKGDSELSKKSFVDIMLDLSAIRDSIQVVSNETNSITYAPDLAAATRDLLESQPPSGIYHITNSGGVSWFELAKETFRLAGKRVNVVPVDSNHFPRKAVRPLKAVLLNTKLPLVRPWSDALAEFLEQHPSL